MPITQMYATSDCTRYYSATTIMQQAPLPYIRLRQQTELLMMAKIIIIFIITTRLLAAPTRVGTGRRARDERAAGRAQTHARVLSKHATQPSSDATASSKSTERRLRGAARRPACGEGAPGRAALDAAQRLVELPKKRVGLLSSLGQGRV